MNILMSINDNYIEQALVLINSILIHNYNSFCKFYFLNQNLSVEGQEKIKHYIEKHDARFIPVYVETTVFESAPGRSDISVETYFRLLAFKLLPKVNKILYLDADMLVTENLEELYNTDISDKCIAGVRDQGEVQNDKYHKARIGLKGNFIYINGGVLLMNLERIRKKFKEEQIYALINYKKKYLIYQDQDIVNILFRDEILILPVKYNQAPLYQGVCDFKKYIFEEAVNREKLPTIIHYMGEKTKPWNNRFYGYKYFRVYYKYCKAVPEISGLKKKMYCNLMRRPVALLNQYFTEIVVERNLK